MKIGMIPQPWEQVVPPMHSGSSIALIAYQLARSLVETNEVTIYAARGKSQPRLQFTQDGICIKRISGVGKRFYQVLDLLTGFWNLKSPLFASSLFYITYILQVSKDIGRRQLDVVHIFNLAQYAMIIRRYASNVKIILHIQGHSLNQLRHSTIESQLRDVDLIVGCSDYITNQARKRFPQLAERCHTVYNGVDLQRFTLPKREKKPIRPKTNRILYVGRVSPEKGVHVLVNAFRMISDAHPGVHLDIVGGVGMLPYSYLIGLSKDPKVSKLATFYGTNFLEKINRQLIYMKSSYLNDLKSHLTPTEANRVHFHGPVAHKELPRAYGNADVFVFPSVFNEPFGIPIIEAMACSLPVVATRGGGIPEIVADNETGLLVKRADEKGLASALVRMITDEESRFRLGDAGRKMVVDSFTWERQAQRLNELYDYL
jgi:glycosyltransferase involved in cell wall biosynthesis